MGKIICLMGKSSTGKDTIYKRLLEDRELGLKKIVPYTTRPIRDGETDGVEYFFKNEEDFLRLKEQGKIIEDREYHTFHGLWRYFVADDGQIESSGNYIMIGTLEAYRHLQDYFGTDRVLPVMIELDDGARLQRALNRERRQEQPRYEEMCRRFLADSEDFSEEKIAEAGIKKRFINNKLGRCLNHIRRYIEAAVK
ncbi:MAG: guanylate kinase [Butyrivibrio sp.]|nr:guanylate kinase [Acetatifactor muris]MCM1558581.1 guanylate kinase [Butyrivibrio sp.]